MTILAPFGPTDSALLHAMVARAVQGSSEAQVEAAPALLVAYLATPRTLEELYPWGARRHFRPRMVRGLVRQLLDAGQIVTDGNPANPADWSWLWAATAAPPAPGARPDQERLDRLTPKIPELDWHQHHVEPDAAPEAPAAEETDETDKKRGWLPETHNEGVCLEEVAKIFGVSRERIRQIETKALNKIRTRAPELFNLLTGGTVKAGRGRICRPQRPAPPVVRPAPPPRRPAPKPAAAPLPPAPVPHPEEITVENDCETPEEEKTVALWGERSAQILEALENHPNGLKMGELVNLLGCPTGTARNALSRAEKKCLVRKNDEGRWVLIPTSKRPPRALVTPRRPLGEVGEAQRQKQAENQRAVLVALAAGPSRSCDIQKATGLGSSVFFRTAKELLASGALVKGQYGVYHLPGQTAPAPAPLALAPVARLPEPRRNASVTPAPAGDRLAAARAAVAALSPEELDALLASLAPVVEARKALELALAGLRGAA